MLPYRYAIDEDAAEGVLHLSLKNREQLVRVFRLLAADPFQKGDSETVDSIGRAIQHKRFGGWIVSFWTDHPVHEVRIVAVRRRA